MMGFDRDHDGRVSFEEYMTRICGPGWQLTGTSIFTEQTCPPLSEQASMPQGVSLALEQLQVELDGVKMADLRSLRSIKSAHPRMEQLFGLLLKLLGQQGLDWRYARHSLVHPKELLGRMDKLKDMVLVGHAPWRNFETAHQVRDEWIEDFGSVDVYVNRIAEITQAAEGVARWVVAMIRFYDVINLIPNAATVETQESEMPEQLQQLEGKLESLIPEDFAQMSQLSERPVYTVEVLEGILAMLGQSAHGWDQLQSTVLRHPDQLKQAMHLLAHMVACSEAPTQNFEAVAETVGLWEEGGMVEKAATESSVAAVICEWGIGLYAYHQASLANPNQGSLGTGY
eukprot:TRINITY_DN1295_c0_g2_i3.p1 TRINITY_DN1295_c0_g2~~TRINITY_DN1295_c0_g2_i3.p1  ORF type:complete len:342 (+),score=87.36 TRINITY_DN1295_c0_g2_i3:320-1345(+)